MHDHDTRRISEWINALERQLDFAMLMERYDEGLAVLSGYLGCRVEDLRYTIETGTRSSNLRPKPTAAERARLRHLNQVSVMIYARFKTLFEQKWTALGANGPRLVAALRTANRAMSV